MKKIQAGKEAGDAPPVAKKPARRSKKGTATSEAPVATQLPLTAPATVGHDESDAAPGNRNPVEVTRSEAAPSESEVIESGSDLASIEQPETSDHRSRQTWCFLTNRTNLLSILGMGAITRSEQAWRYAPDSRDAAAGAIPIWRGATPRSLAPLLEKEGADSPVILEFSDGLHEFIPTSSGAACVSSDPIPFATVTRVRFKDRKTLDDFKLKSFDDTPIIPEQLLEDSLGTSTSLAEVDFAASATPEQPSFRLDKVLGGLMAVTEALTERASACRFYCALVDALVQELRATGSFVDSFAPQISDARLTGDSPSTGGDLWLLGETLRFLDRVDPDVGLDPFAFIDQVEANLGAEGGGAGGVNLSQILTWCSFTKRLLNGDEEVRQLTDAGSIVQRAVLLFLMRPEQQRFRKIQGSNINPGSRVYMLASVFMGYFVGLQRMESILKQTGRRYFEFVAHFIKQQRRDGRSERVTLMQPRDGRGEFAVLHGELELAKFEIKLSDSLQQVFHQIKRIGLQSHYNFIDQEVCCSISDRGGVDVKIGLVADPLYGETLRFYSECTRIPRATEQLGQLAIMLLKRNALPGIHGRFAIARGGRHIIYVQDQLLDTMDRSELETHIRHVAEVTARFSTEFPAEK